MNRRYLDMGFCSLLIGASILILTRDDFVHGGVETQLGSLALPRLAAALILLFSLTIAVSSLRRIRSETPLGDQEKVGFEGLGGVATYLAIFLIYWWVLPLVGFLVATPVAMMAIALLLGGRSWLAMTAVSLILPALVFYGCRDLIRVYLPGWSL